MADQNERAFQKQSTIFLNRKKGLKRRKSMRYSRNVGLGFETPREGINRGPAEAQSQYQILKHPVHFVISITRVNQESPVEIPSECKLIATEVNHTPRQLSIRCSSRTPDLVGLSHRLSTRYLGAAKYANHQETRTIPL